MSDFPDSEAATRWFDDNYSECIENGINPVPGIVNAALGDDRLFTMVLSPGDPWTVDQHIESYAKSYYYNLNIRQAWPKEATDADA